MGTEAPKYWGKPAQDSEFTAENSHPYRSSYIYMGPQETLNHYCSSLHFQMLQAPFSQVHRMLLLFLKLATLSLASARAHAVSCAWNVLSPLPCLYPLPSHFLSF